MIVKVGDWVMAQAILQGAPKKVAQAVKTAVYQEAQFLAGEVKKKIRTGPFKGLSAWTIAGRRVRGFRGSKPLNVTGDLKASIVVFPAEPAFECFVGVLKQAKRKQEPTDTKATPLINIAQVLEEGRVFMLRVTPKMRRFIMGVLVPALGSGGGGAGGSLRRGILVIRIPPRPFLKPTLDEFGPQLPDRFARRLARLLVGFSDGKAPEPPKPAKEPDSPKALPPGKKTGRDKSGRFTK